MAGSLDRRNVAFPTGNVEGSDWLFLTNFGGMGAGEPQDPSPYRYIYWPIEVNPFSGYNKKLILHNSQFFVYSDSNMTQKAPYAVLTAYHPPTSGFDPSQALGSVEIPANVRLPIQVEFDQMSSDKIILPQPSSGEYESIIYVIIDMKQTGRYIGTTDQIIEAMEVAEFQFEGTP